MELRLKNTRISFAQGLWKKSAAVETATPKHNCDYILDDKSVVEMKNAEGKWVVVRGGIKEAEKLTVVDAFKGNAAKAKEWFDELNANQRSVRDGNKNKGKDGEVRDGYVGNMYVHATSETRMPVLDAQAREVASEEDSPIYSGCYVTARVSLYANLKPGKKGVFASMQGTQFTGEGDAFGGGRRAAREDFEPAEGADAGDFAPEGAAAGGDSPWA